MIVLPLFQSLDLPFTCRDEAVEDKGDKAAPSLLE
jgi:hypothetical protein